MNNPLVLILVGIVTGIYSGIMGLGGGTVMVPIMVLALGFSQHQAVATSLAAMIPPVTLPAVIEYYRRGQVRPGTAGWIALGILLGTPLGAMAAGYLSDRGMKMVFGLVLVYVGGYTVFNTLGRHLLVRSMIFAGVLMLVAVALFWAMKWYDARV